MQSKCFTLRNIKPDLLTASEPSISFDTQANNNVNNSPICSQCFKYDYVQTEFDDNKSCYQLIITSLYNFREQMDVIYKTNSRREV